MLQCLFRAQSFGFFDCEQCLRKRQAASGRLSPTWCVPVDFSFFDTFDDIVSSFSSERCIPVKQIKVHQGPRGTVMVRRFSIAVFSMKERNQEAKRTLIAYPTTIKKHMTPMLQISAFSE